MPYNLSLFFAGLVVFSVIFSGCGPAVHSNHSAKPETALPSVFPAVPSASAALPRRSQPTAKKTIAEFNISSGPELILLPVDFNGRQYRFLLDTGASRTVFDDSLKSMLPGRPTRTEQASVAHGKFVRFEYYKAPDARVGPMSLKRCIEVATLDLHPISRIAKRPVDGVIGMDFLRHYTVQLDFDNGKARFLKNNTRSNSDWGQPLAVNYAHDTGLPLLGATILQNMPVSFIIDTGHSTMLKSGYLEKSILDKICQHTKCSNVKSQIATAAEIRVLNHKHTVIDDLAVGGFTYKQSLFSENKESLLGMWFLSQHMVTFDFPAGMMYLKKGNRWGMFDNFAFSLSKYGFGLKRNGENVVIDSIDPRGPAAKTGIKPDDIVLELAGLDLKPFGMTDIYLMLRSATDNLTMKLLRGKDIRQVSIALAP